MNFCSFRNEILALEKITIWRRRMNRECRTLMTEEIHPDCIQCLLQGTGKLINKYRIPDDIAGEIISRFRKYIDDHRSITAPEAACLMHRYFKSATGIQDPYSEEKRASNKLLKNLEDEIRDVIHVSNSPFQTALRYALAGNIIDYGPREPFNIYRALSEAVSNNPAIDHSRQLEDELRKASKVLYLGDNAGEIILDKLFIETISHPTLYFAVRGANIINDVTMDDAEIAGIPKIARVISNGYGAPSTIVNRSSPVFRKIYSEAEVIISKGQGNLEGLLHARDKKIFFLLMVKCNVIAERLGAQIKDVVVLYNQKLPEMIQLGYVFQRIHQV